MGEKERDVIFALFILTPTNAATLAGAR